jgi:hypothetical protein
MKIIKGFIGLGITFLVLISVAKLMRISSTKTKIGEHYVVRAVTITVDKNDSTVIGVNEPFPDIITIPVPANFVRNYMYEVEVVSDQRLKYIKTRSLYHR